MTVVELTELLLLNSGSAVSESTTEKILSVCALQIGKKSDRDTTKTSVSWAFSQQAFNYNCMLIYRWFPYKKDPVL